MNRCLLGKGGGKAFLRETPLRFCPRALRVKVLPFSMRFDGSTYSDIERDMADGSFCPYLFCVRLQPSSQLVRDVRWGVRWRGRCFFVMVGLPFGTHDRFLLILYTCRKTDSKIVQKDEPGKQGNREKQILETLNCDFRENILKTICK